jgi:hypothetical protein
LKLNKNIIAAKVFGKKYIRVAVYNPALDKFENIDLFPAKNSNG